MGLLVYTGKLARLWKTGQNGQTGCQRNQGAGEWGGEMSKSNSTLETEASRENRRPKPKNTEKIQTRTKVQGSHHEYCTTHLGFLQGQYMTIA